MPHPNARISASQIQTLQRAPGDPHMAKLFRVAIAFALFALVAAPVLTQAARIVA
jgi:hypothetical protein